jgi:hypothetical protein
MTRERKGWLAFAAGVMSMGLLAAVKISQMTINPSPARTDLVEVSTAAPATFSESISQILALFNPAGAGSLAVPGIQIGEATTGLVGQIGSHTLSVSCGGVNCGQFEPVASGVNFIDFLPGATGAESVNGPTVRALGADVNIGLYFASKGAGRMIWTAGGHVMDFNADGNGLLRVNGGDINAGNLHLGNLLNFNSDSGMARRAPSVSGFSDGNQNSNGWMQWSGECYTAADATNATTTMASSGCTISNLFSGRKYTFQCELYLSDSTSVDGAKIDFNGGTATSTYFRAQVTAFDTALNLSSQLTSLSASSSASTFSGAGAFEVHGSFEPAAGGTFIPEFAQVGHTTGTLTLARGSFCRMFDSP